MAEYAKPLPKITKLDKPFWAAAKEHQFRLQKCANCGYILFPPYPRCPQCLSTELEWTNMSGRGKVWSWIVMHQPYYPAFADELPYNVALVQLEEGPIMVSRIVDCDKDIIRCDMPVEIVFDDVTSDVSLPKFKPLG